MKVHFATPLRGFFQHLLKEPEINVIITSEKNSIYELNSWKKKIVANIARSSLFDLLGVIKSIQAQGGKCDCYGSFNRFLVSDKPYFIYVENPSALFHYRLGRNRTILGAKKIKRLINNKQLKALVCMSRACCSTFEDVCSKVPDSVKLTQIYPLVPDNNLVSDTIIRNRCVKDEVKLLYIAQGQRFTSKGAYEVLEAFKRLRLSTRHLTLSMVTALDQADSNALELARSTEGVELFDFKFSYQEMQKLYSEHTILLIPTSDDSFNLTVLEAMKAGLPVIGSRLYAIPEMVHDGENGYLCDPAYWFFDKNNIPNPKVWNHRNRTIYSGKRDERVTEFLYNNIRALIEDRDALVKMSLDSLHKATSTPFSREHIISQWNELFEFVNH